MQTLYLSVIQQMLIASVSKVNAHFDKRTGTLSYSFFENLKKKKKGNLMGKIVDNEIYAQNARNCQINGDQKKQEADNTGAKIERLNAAKKILEEQLVLLNGKIDGAENLFNGPAGDMSPAGNWKGDLKNKCKFHFERGITNLTDMENDYQDTLKNINGELAKLKVSQIDLLGAAQSFWDQAQAWWNSIQ